MWLRICRICEVRREQTIAARTPFAGCVLFAVMVTPVRAQVSSSRLANHATDDGNWLMYSGSYSSLRFSPLDRISTDNVGRLKPLWVYQPPGSGSLEATPVVADGVMYMTSGPASVVALDLRSGNPLWQWSRPIAPTVLNLGFPRVNRGVAILDNTGLCRYARRLSRRARREDRWSALDRAGRRQPDWPRHHRGAARR